MDAATQAVTRRQMTPFGEARGSAPQAWAGSKGFVNGTQDPTGLTHLGAREYDPSTGRFISVDPIADLKDPQQINGYAYSNNNPVTFADPDGKFFGAIFAIIRAIIRLINAVRTYYSNLRSSNSGSGGMTTMGSASRISSSGGGGGDSCPLVKRNYGICDSNEPADPRAEGSFKDALGGAAEVGGATLDFLEYATEPWCWFGANCGGAEESVKKFEEKHGVDTDSKSHDSGKDFTEAASLLNIGGLVKKAIKELLGATAKKGGKEVAEEVVSANIDPRKMDYLFNKNIKKDDHNSPRAKQNAGQLKKIGFDDTPASREFVANHLRDATKNGFSEKFTNKWGEFGVTESVLYGRHGAVGATSTWQILPDGTYRFSTVIFKG